MRRYMVFAGSFYYPIGGMEDLVGHFDTVDEALSSLLTYESGSNVLDAYDRCECDGSWAYVYDTEEEKIVRGMTCEQAMGDDRDLYMLYGYGLAGYRKGEHKEPPPSVLERLRAKYPDHPDLQEPKK